jgi:hypothetical protein
MTLREKRLVFTRHLGKLLAWLETGGYHHAVDETKRSWCRQIQLLATGASKTRHSKHLDGLAVDILLYDSQGNYLTEWHHYRAAGAFWKSLDPENVWGGDWGWDADHFQYGK